MSARGWAETLTRAAQVADRDARDFERIRPRCPEAVERARTDAAVLRELANLLERDVALTSREGVAITMTAEQLLRAVTRGPAEQQETGR